jgi:hypothetical protein
MRLNPQLAAMHHRISELQRAKAVADTQVSALESMLLSLNRSECDVRPLHFSRAFLPALFCARLISWRQIMTSHNGKLVQLQEKAREMNAAVSAALAVVREQGRQSRAKDAVIAELQKEVEAE